MGLAASLDAITTQEYVSYCPGFNRRRHLRLHTKNGSAVRLTRRFSPTPFWVRLTLWTGPSIRRAGRR